MRRALSLDCEGQSCGFFIFSYRLSLACLLLPSLRFFFLPPFNDVLLSFLLFHPALFAAAREAYLLQQQQRRKQAVVYIPAINPSPQSKYAALYTTRQSCFTRQSDADARVLIRSDIKTKQNLHVIADCRVWSFLSSSYPIVTLTTLTILTTPILDA